jgi:signal transduction histidine kinase
MRLQLKFVIYNALSKALIIGAFALLLPLIAEQVVYKHIDNRLEARRDLLLKKIKLGGLDQALLEEDCSFDDYNIFKEEFVSIKPIRNDGIYNPDSSVFVNEIWTIDDVYHQEHRVIRQPFLYDNQWYELNIGEGISAIEKLKRTIVEFSLWSMAVIVLASIFIDVGFVRILLRPFYLIVDKKLRETTAPLQFHFHKIKSSTYEFAYLDESINNLMRKIQDTIHVEREFIANVSHELLTPLSILKTRLENIVTDPATPESVSQRIVEAQQSVNRLSKIIRSLLMISRIENEQYLKNETADLPQLVSEILDELEDRIQSRGLTVTQQTEPFTFANCNRSLIYTMISNLVNNAIKYNRDNGRIIINGRTDGNGYVLEISDTGCGIDPQNLETIFSRFKKLNKDDENSYGLGLPIVKTIAAFHRIDIAVSSTVNEGSTFRLLFKNSTA